MHHIRCPVCGPSPWKRVTRSRRPDCVNPYDGSRNGFKNPAELQKREKRPSVVVTGTAALCTSLGCLACHHPQNPRVPAIMRKWYRTMRMTEIVCCACMPQACSFPDVPTAKGVFLLGMVSNASVPYRGSAQSWKGASIQELPQGLEDASAISNS